MSCAVDDSTITVSFIVKKQLPKHHRYTSFLEIAADGFCPVMDGADLNERPAKGRTVRLRFSSHDDPLNPGATWCAGEAEITVASLTNGQKTTDTGTLLGYEDFTVRPRGHDVAREVLAREGRTIGDEVGGLHPLRQKSLRAASIRERRCLCGAA